MEIRKAKIEDFESIKDIYLLARKFMAEMGNLTQWADIEQLQNSVLEDIKAGNCYLYIDNDKIVAAFCFFIGDDSTYEKIYNGEWLNDMQYGVIHRIVVCVHQQGIATECIQWCLNKFSNIRIDTHKDNIPMQKTILKNGFKYCGIIEKEDGTQRLAYQHE